MASADTEYEKYVRNIIEALLRAQGLHNVAVEHNVKMRGTSRSHQVDVYWKYRLGGIDHEVIINCKNYKDTVEVTDVLTLAGVLADMPGKRGLIVTTKGYQKGAVDYATTHQIGLKVIRPPEDSDWEGRLRKIRMSFRFDLPQLIDCNIMLDLDWVKANVTPDPLSLVGRSTQNAQLMRVRDVQKGTTRDMNELWNTCMQQNPTEAGSEGRGTLTWADARLERPGTAEMKVNSIEFVWRIVRGTEDGHVVEIQHHPEAIVRDVMTGHLLFVDPSGTISGDVKKEFGSES